MQQLNIKSPVVLGIGLYNRGFGFALVHDAKLINWGLALLSGAGDKNQWAIKRLKRLISQWNPDVVVFEDALAKDSNRSPRIRRLIKSMVTMSISRGIKVKTVPRKRLAMIVTGDERGTKYEIAEAILKQFPNELTPWLPPKRKAWMLENPKLRVFDAVALALCATRKTRLEPTSN
jgi:RNase H-fold protein (predicted Holliday junction resolvase)